MEGIYSLHRENKLVGGRKWKAYTVFTGKTSWWVVGSGRHIQSSQVKQAGGRKWKAYTVFTGKTSWW